MQPLERSQPRRSDDPPEIPGYELGEPIGRGSSGVVYRARQLAVDRDVAVKVLHPELCANKQVIQRLQREARTTARLAHPHLVSAIDMGETDGVWWYAMERIDGDSLDVRLHRQGRLSEREALRLFIPLCEALEHLWEHGVVHRDIKPANILIDRSGGARLGDFGLAVAEDDPLLTGGGTLGTPHYMSPEQAIDAKSVDIRTDIWSFGATLFHCVCGRPPFHGNSTAEILSGVLHERIPDPLELQPGLSRGLALVMRKCLTRDRAHRYATPRLLLEDLERVRERRQPNVRRGSLEPVRSRGDLRRAMGVLGVALVLLLAGLAVGSVWFEQGSAGADADRLLDTPLPYEPLESLAKRSLGHPDVFAQSLRELAELRTALPVAHLPRWEELDRALRGELRATVRDLQGEIEVELARHFDEFDLAAARSLVQAELSPRFLARTGLARAELARERVSIDPWIAQVTGKVDAAIAAAIGRLEVELDDWSATRVARVDALVDRGQWASARRLLEVDAAQILAAAGFGGYRFPSEQQQDALASARIALKLRRQHLDDDWLSTDAELRRWVRDSALALATDLAEAPVPFAAADELDAALERELRRQRLTRAAMPEALGRTALEELARRTKELRTLERELRERLARTELADLEEMGAALARRRDYLALVGLWEEAPAAWGDAVDGADWVVELRRVAQTRRLEAQMLNGLLVRTADAVRALAGRAIDLRISGILYPAREVQAGVDPLHDGFWIEGRTERLELQTLAPGDLERLAGLEPLESLEPSDRLLVALFRFHEGLADGARQVLRSGTLPEREPEASIVRDLSARVSARVERDREDEQQRAAEADRLLALVVDPIRIEHSPTSVAVRIDRLLEEFGDVAAVRDRRRDLVRLKRRLESGGAVRASAFDTVFVPQEVSFPGPGRVRMSFTFGDEDGHAWQAGSWISDGFGWSLPSAVDGWEDLTAQEGPRLVLQRPLDIDSTGFEIEVHVEPLTAEDTPRLLVLSAAGFHVVIGGAELPDTGSVSRWLVGTAGVADVLARLRGGEGEPLGDRLAAPGAHRVVVRADREAGRVEVEVDGQVLGSVAAGSPSRLDIDLELRSWEPLRLTRVVVEAGR